MISNLYQKTFSVLMKRPFRLWGLSLLAGVLLLAAQAGFIGVPAVAFCAASGSHGAHAAGATPNPASHSWTTGMSTRWSPSM